jgi:hypothetical protein
MTDWLNHSSYTRLRADLNVGGDQCSIPLTQRTPTEHEEIILAKRAAVDLARSVGRLDIDESNYRTDGRRDVTDAIVTPAETRAGLRRAIREAGL